jgi:hypothetical protein
MAIYQLTVDVHYSHPTGINDDSRYRIYVDQELMAERSWNWLTNVLVQENLIVELNPGAHTVSLVEANKDITQGRFNLKDLTVNGTNTDNSQGLVISFNT